MQEANLKKLAQSIGYIIQELQTKQGLQPYLEAKETGTEIITIEAFMVHGGLLHQVMAIQHGR